MSEQIEDQMAVAHDMPILLEREKLEWRITKNIWILLLCKLEEIPCTVILQLMKDLEEWRP